MKIECVYLGQGRIELTSAGRLIVEECRFPIGATLSMQCDTAPSSDPACGIGAPSPKRVATQETIKRLEDQLVAAKYSSLDSIAI